MTSGSNVKSHLSATILVTWISSWQEVMFKNKWEPLEENGKNVTMKFSLNFLEIG